MRRQAPAKSVDAYLAVLPPKTRACLQKLRKAIKAAAPKAQERIGYGIAGYYQGRPVVFFAAFKKHLGFYPLNRAMQKALAKDLSAFVVKGSSLHFTPEQPLTAALVKKLVKFRLGQNAALDLKETKGKK